MYIAEKTQSVISTTTTTTTMKSHKRGATHTLGGNYAIDLTLVRWNMFHDAIHTHRALRQSLKTVFFYSNEWQNMRYILPNTYIILISLPIPAVRYTYLCCCGKQLCFRNGQSVVPRINSHSHSLRIHFAEMRSHKK